MPTPPFDPKQGRAFRRFLAVQARQCQEARCRGIALRLYNLRPCLLTIEQNFFVVTEERTPHLKLGPEPPTADGPIPWPWESS